MVQQRCRTVFCPYAAFYGASDSGARQTTQAASSAATAASVHAQRWRRTHRLMNAWPARWRKPAAHGGTEPENARGTGAGHGSAEAQDKAAAAFYRQIDSVKQPVRGCRNYSVFSSRSDRPEKWRDWSAGLSGADF